jgi:hypothetical protein
VLACGFRQAIVQHEWGNALFSAFLIDELEQLLGACGVDIALRECRGCQRHQHEQQRDDSTHYGEGLSFVTAKTP